MRTSVYQWVQKQKAFKPNSMCNAVSSTYDSVLARKKRTHMAQVSSGLPGDRKVLFTEFFK